MTTNGACSYCVTPARSRSNALEWPTRRCNGTGVKIYQNLFLVAMPGPAPAVSGQFFRRRSPNLHSSTSTIPALGPFWSDLGVQPNDRSAIFDGPSRHYLRVVIPRRGGCGEPASAVVRIADQRRVSALNACHSAACAMTCWRNFGITSCANSRIESRSQARFGPLQSRPVISKVPNGPTVSRKAMSLSRKVLVEP